MRAPRFHTATCRHSGQLLLDMNRADLTSFAQAASDGFLVIRHLRDEATMRLRSTVEVEPFRGTTAAPVAAGDPAVPTAVREAAAPAADQAGFPRRGRSSKIQNSVVSLHHGPGGSAQLQMLLELQPLGRKDARTLATALHEVPNVIARATHGATKLIHCLVGDGVPTHAAAARTLMEWMHRDGIRDEKVHSQTVSIQVSIDFFRGCVRYRQLCFTCATHTANLVVRGAICTGGTDAGDGHPLVAVCVRFFKFHHARLRSGVQRLIAPVRHRQFELPGGPW